MKKLNITKKQYDESKYFNQKYGALKFVSESGKLYKTDKGVVIALESTEDEEDEEPKGGDDEVKTPGEGEEEITVKKEDLATALQDVIDTVKDIAADNDVTLPGEEGEDDEEGDDDEVVPGDDDDDEGDEDLELGFVEDGDKGDRCPTCGCKKGSCKKEEDECTTTECGGSKPALESRIRRIRRARMVREAAKRRARAKKVLESIRRRRIAKKVLESARRRRLAKKMMESRKVSPLARRIRMRKMMESARRRARARRLGR